MNIHFGETNEVLIMKITVPLCFKMESNLKEKLMQRYKL